MYHLSLDVLPKYKTSSFRYFQKHEKHVTRICNEDVLVLMFDGVLRLHENGIPIELKKNEYYIERHGLYQEGIEESDRPQYYYIHFSGDFSPAEKSLPIRGTADVSSLIPAFHELDLLKATNASQVAIASVFYRILFELSKTHSCSRQQQNIIQNVLSYVLQNFNRPISMDEISLAVGYCKNHITNVFQKETGRSPQAYITDYRIETAKHLLLNTNRTLDQISRECGFGNYINFYKSFMKKEKISPSDWRQQQNM